MKNLLLLLLAMFLVGCGKFSGLSHGDHVRYSEKGKLQAGWFLEETKNTVVIRSFNGKPYTIDGIYAKDDIDWIERGGSYSMPARKSKPEVFKKEVKSDYVPSYHSREK